MAEFAKPVQTLQVTYHCDECDKEMSYILSDEPCSIPPRLSTSKPKYLHSCPNGHKVELDKSYPYLKYVRL